MRCECVILPFVPCPALIIFPTLSHKRHDLKKKLLNTSCDFQSSLQLLSKKFFILRRTERVMIKYVYWFSCKVPVILVRL